MRKELSLINKCKSWKECNQHIAKLTTGRQAKLGGSVFELVVKLYLQTEPKYQTKFKQVWLLDEVPYKIKKYLNLPRADEGIDLIVKTNEDEYWSVQVKYRSDINETLVFGGKGGLSTFQSLSFVTCKNIKHGLLCITINKPPVKKHLLKNIGFEVADTWIGLDDNDKAAWKRIQLKAKGKTPKIRPAKPLLPQKEAIKKAKEHFIKKKSTRGKLIMPCGTGKSLTSYWIAHELKAKKMIIAVPSIALVKQTLNVWAKETILNKRKIEWLCVCSDETVDSDQDEIVSSTSDLGIRPTTNQEEIEKFIKRKTNNLKIIFTTYQSGQVTAKAARKTKTIFDLGIFDEAHKTVGHKDKKMAHLLLEKNVKIKKRLFMTATERIFRMNKDEYLSMDDPRDYGQVFYQLSFKKAIESRPSIISDYKIITFGVSEDEIKNLINSNKFIRVRKEVDDITARELAVGIALRKAIRKIKIRNTLTFHSSIKRSENFAKQQELISKIYPQFGKLNTFHINGTMSASKRTSLLKDFGDSKKSLMTNARCLTEGIDLPSIDCVCFADPKRSKVDIVQAAGRALRLSKGKKFGYILIPIFVPHNQDPNKAAKDSVFEEIVSTVGALSVQDTRIADYLRAVAAGTIPKKKAGPISEITKINVLTKIDSNVFEKSIQLKIWNKIARINYRPFNEARRFVHELKLNSTPEFRQFRRLNKIPIDIPFNPRRTYKNKGWISMGDFLGTGRIADQLKIFKSFKEAKVYVRGLKLKNIEEWTKYKKTGKLPKDIPLNPGGVYKNNGWIGWGDFLGTGYIAPQFRNYLPFKKARAYMRSLKLKSKKEFVKLAKSGKLPENIPKNPGGVYKNKGWTSMGIFLGYRSHVPYKFRKYRPFIKARMYAHSLKLKNHKEWYEQYKAKKLPKDIPLEAAKIYKNKGWIGWGDFLGTGYISANLRNYCPFPKARVYARSHKLKNAHDWFRLSKKRILPKDMPSVPNHVYKNKGWINWGDFLGTGNISANLRNYCSFAKAKACVHRLKLKSRREFNEYKKTGKLPKDIATSPDATYKKKGWKGWQDFLGKTK